MMRPLFYAMGSMRRGCFIYASGRSCAPLIVISQTRYYSTPSSSLHRRCRCDEVKWGLFRGSFVTQRRHVQFRKTSEMNVAINSGTKAAQKWVMKSTAEYAANTATAMEAGVLAGDADRKRAVSARQVALEKKRAEMLAWSDNQTARINEFQTLRRRRYANFFSRYGWTFLLLYIVLYVVFFIAIWSALAVGIFDMLTIFEFLFCFISGHVDRPTFFERVEAWGSWSNVGFAFLINECFDVIRVPLTVLLWWIFRRGLIRMKTNTVFRWNAPEYDIELRRVERSIAEAGAKGADGLQKTSSSEAAITKS